MHFAGAEWTVRVWEPDKVIGRLIDRMPDWMFEE
jgi:hypothetical protein